ncbi:MAG: glycoside hydrolase family 13 protein [Cyanobacteria bacterium P01_A01_bin.105]
MENRVDIQTPKWVKHAVFYQIFPDRFARTTRPHRPATMQVPLEPWDSPPTPQGYKGGDLWGCAEQLDYLQGLGINAVYFTPIFQSASNHRYHTHDYYQVDPLLGGNAAFFDFLEAAHKRDIKVVLDGVFNHASRGFFFFNDILENGPHSPWLDWFKIQSWPLSAYDGSLPANYESWWNIRSLPEFNHDNAEVREYIMGIGEYWIQQGVDGWRLDVPFDVKAEGFWQEFRQRVKAVNPEAYIVGEIWTDASQWLDGTQFDGVMNYLFTGPTLAYTAKDNIVMPLVEKPAYYPYPPLDAAGYAEKVEELLAMYPWQIQLTQLNLLSSHDIARALSVVGEDRSSFELAVLLQMTFPGAPSVYYGDEVGLPGKLDPDCRRVFPPSADWDRSLLECHQQLIRLRHQHVALRTGVYNFLAADGEGYAFARVHPEETVTIVVNAGDMAITLALPATPAVKVPDKILFGTGEFSTRNDGVTVTVPARSGVIWV